jgi:hypothetical protein
MAKGFNGGIIGTRNLTTGGGVGQGSAVGIYSLNEAQIAKLAGLWPQEVGSGQIQGTQVFTTSSTYSFVAASLFVSGIGRLIIR